MSQIIIEIPDNCRDCCCFSTATISYWHTTKEEIYLCQAFDKILSTMEFGLGTKHDICRCDECINAEKKYKKEMPQKIIKAESQESSYIGECPICENVLHTGLMESHYCHWCGQKLEEPD